MIKKRTEKDCLLEIERMVRLALEYDVDEDFLKQIRTTTQYAIKELNFIRKAAAERKEATQASNYAKKMGIRR